MRSPDPVLQTESAPAAASGSRASFGSLTIGDLAERTGLKPATIRMWEARHGFPTAERRESGHRRYSETDVDLVNQVVRRQRAGARLELAIAEVAVSQAAIATPPEAPSVYAVLRSRHPALQAQRLKKSTLIALSWAIEDECCSRAERPVIFGAFQRERYFRTAEERWTELARIARAAIVFADFGPSPTSVEGAHLVHLPADAPMRREWVVVCDAPDYPAMLTAWELPGQSTVTGRQRLFETIWTVDPVVVRDAARVCARVALHLGEPAAGALLHELATTPVSPTAESLRAMSLLNRVVSYIDATG